MSKKIQHRCQYFFLRVENYVLKEKDNLMKKLEVQFFSIFERKSFQFLVKNFWYGWKNCSIIVQSLYQNTNVSICRSFTFFWINLRYDRKIFMTFEGNFSSFFNFALYSSRNTLWGGSVLQKNIYIKTFG